MASEQTTQLADTRPYLDTPLRVSLPVNVPIRVLPPSRNSIIHDDAYSPSAVAGSKREGQKLLSLFKQMYQDPVNMDEDFAYRGNSSLLSKKAGKQNKSSEHEAMLKNTMKDFTVLAFSSKRAGRKDVEGTAYASLGVVYDNEEEYLVAVDFYQKYLAVAEELGDNMGIAAACNCIGVNYMTLANPNNESGVTLAQLLSEETRLNVLEYVHKAVDYHSRHLEIGPDPGGRLVAHINLGICLTWLGDLQQAAKHHQDALRIAIKMQTLYGQAIAVGNLGMLALGKEDFGTARTCFDQHLQLIQALMDSEAEIHAWKMCADLSIAQSNFTVAIEHLEQARTIAEREGLLHELRRIHVLIGVARGTMEFAEYTSSLPRPTSEVVLT